MLYDESWLQNFDGEIDPVTGREFKPSNVDISELANSLEKYCSQFIYTYETSLTEYPIIKIKFKNENIPHLLGLSRNHHYNLPTYYSSRIFDSLKSEWDLEYLRSSDKKWFDESQDKLVGTLLLYKMLNLIDSQTYTSMKWGRIQHSRLQRDDIYFIILNDTNGKSYSLEISKQTSQDDFFFPKSLKINDNIFDQCDLIEIALVEKERISSRR